MNLTNLTLDTSINCPALGGSVVDIFLVDDEVIAEYLNAALEDENPDVFLIAVGNVAKARGMTAIAQITGLGRESLCKAMAPGAKPRYDTVLKVLHSLGVRVTVSSP